MSYLPPIEGIDLYTASQTRQLDRCAIEQHQIAGFELMKRAARAAYRALRQRWPDAKKLTLLCGGGNNGGDALVVAAMALEQQLEIQVLLVGGEVTRSKLAGEALEALVWAESRGVVVETYSSSVALSGDVLVDGLLGTGLSGAVRTDFAEPIEHINSTAKPVLALDIPSGLCADTGAVLGCAVRADLTVSFIGLKRGLLTQHGVECCGELLFEGLGVPPEVYQAVPTPLRVVGQKQCQQQLPLRSRGAHKGDFGHVMVVGGDRGMAGSVVMATEAAVRSGAGLVSVATRPEHVGLTTGRNPEVMSHAVSSGQELEPLLARASVVAIGPGLGRSGWSGQLLRVVQSQSLPLVVDADALNLLSQAELVEPSQRDNWILTPHPGEAARLLDCSVAQIQADRFEAVNQLQRRYGGVVVLKGAGTLISDGQQTRLCARGNPGMASGGMGDVLTGEIAALVAQGLSLFDAAMIGVDVHAQAADRVASSCGERGLAATDLIVEIRRLLNPELMMSVVEESGNNA
ncbi:MAG: NAD(P)H-hydrate dehydratase [Halopseudomonas sp.]